MTSGLPVLDRETLFEQVAGDADLVLRLVELFTADTADALARVRDAIARRSPADVEHAAHRLKGSCGALAALAAVHAAQRVEDAGRGRDLRVAAAAADDLERELARLMPELERVVAARGPVTSP